MSIPGNRDMARISKKIVICGVGFRQSTAEYKIGKEPLKDSISEIHSYETNCTVYNFNQQDDDPISTDHYSISTPADNESRK